MSRPINDEIRWCSIKDYPGYEVSDQGQVRSLRRPMGMKPGILSGYRGIYLCKNRQRKFYCIGVLVLEAFKHIRPEGLVMDHKNRIKIDDRLSNLRWTTYSQNNLNRSITLKSSSGGVPGVSWCKYTSRWRARGSQVNGRRINLGRFKTIAEAKAAVLRSIRL